MKLLVPPPVQALICAGLMWLTVQIMPQLGFEFSGRVQLATLFVILGAALDILSLGLFMRAKTTVSPLDPTKSEKLVVNGLYRFTRNPMYLGLLLILTGVGFWFANLAFIPIIVLFVWYITNFQIKPEEEALTAKFGQEYTDYCASVRRWI